MCCVVTCVVSHVWSYSYVVRSHAHHISPQHVVRTILAPHMCVDTHPECVVVGSVQTTNEHTGRTLQRYKHMKTIQLSSVYTSQLLNFVLIDKEVNFHHHTSTMQLADLHV